MPDRVDGLLVQNAIYPDGCARLVAWDHAASGRTSSTTYLLRGNAGYFVHYHMVDHTTSDRLLSLSVQDAELLYHRLRVPVAPSETTIGEPPVEAECVVTPPRPRRHPDP